jgi:DNA-directed RNA polymerase specialized sigma24 family protein
MEPIPDMWHQASARFMTTQWTVLLLAGSQQSGREKAMEEFCSAYWYPVYAFIRRRGRDPEDARDLTQAFFSKMIADDWLAGVERRETRFSTLLLTVLKNFLIKEHARDTAQKRGGGQAPLSIELARAEGWFGAEPVSGESPERIFERRWALAVLDAALGRLQRECVLTGKARWFEVLGPFLSREPEPGDYERAGSILGLERGAVAVSVHRLRRMYRNVLREEIAAGSSDPARIDEEMKSLREALSP